MLRRIVHVITRDGQTKLAALAVTLIVFVVTRDDVERTVTVPVRVVSDPERVLVSELPDSVDVVVHGHWTKVGRLGGSDLGYVSVDLRTAVPGPMSLAPGMVVPPDGVMVERIDAPPIELRFDAVVERSLPVVAPLVGTVHADYEVESVRIEPDRADVRGGEQTLAAFAELTTERVSVAGATADVDAIVALVRPHPSLQFVDAERPRARVRVAVRARRGERTWTIDLATEIAPELTGRELSGLVRPAKATVDVTVRGSLPVLAELRARPRPIRAAIELVTPNDSSAGLRVRFAWDPGVPSMWTDDLEIVPPQVIVAAADPSEPETP